jgi:hypothetical protein
MHKTHIYYQNYSHSVYKFLMYSILISLKINIINCVIIYQIYSYSMKLKKLISIFNKYIIHEIFELKEIYLKFLFKILLFDLLHFSYNFKPKIMK